LPQINPQTILNPNLIFMKKIFLALFASAALLSGCSTQKINTGYFTYDNDLEFKVNYFIAQKFSENGLQDGRTHVSQGGRYITANITFKNKSAEAKNIDFSEFKLLDDQGKEYSASFANSSTGSSFSDGMIQKIKPEKEKDYIVEFWPAFPKDQPIKTILFRGKEIKLQ
jgi:major membrane immunogen (membrane-anchored lipoprotein)